MRPRSSFGDGGFTVFFRPPFHYNETLAIVQELRKNNWIDAYTRAVSLQFTLFAPSANLFASVAMWVEFEFAGGIKPETFIRVFNCWSLPPILF
jgi:hypothetical protein